jgi:AcrR family transcriptional regulator
VADQATDPVALSDDIDVVPEWKRQTMDRSLHRARIRAHERSSRFVTAAIDLMSEQGGVDFTVQDVADRANMSIRTFYKFFESKDDLLVAVYVTIVEAEVVPRLRAQCAAEHDPILAIRAYVDGLFRLSELRQPAARAFARFSLRLAETRPQSLEDALGPQTQLLVELLEVAERDGRLGGALTPVQSAQMVHLTVTNAVHARALGQATGLALTGEQLWHFCAQGIGAIDESSPTEGVSA